MRDECDTTHMLVRMPIRSMSCIKEPKTVLSRTRCPTRQHSTIPPQMQNSAQFGNLITSLAQRVLIDVRRRCKACVVFLCLDGYQSWAWTTNAPRRGGPPCPPAQNGSLDSDIGRCSLLYWMQNLRVGEGCHALPVRRI